MKISVCMPYWNRQDHLDRALWAYARLYKDLELEFSICDDGSSVAVVAPGCLVTSLPRKDYPLNPCVPINIAVRASTADVIVLTNPEVEHQERVFPAMLALLEQPNDYVIATCIDQSGMILAGKGVDYSKDGREPVPEGGHFHFCTMFHRELFEKAGGFDNEYRHGKACEDNDWLYRLASVGARFRTTDKAVYHYRTPTTFRKGAFKRNRDLLHEKWGLRQTA